MAKSYFSGVKSPIFKSLLVFFYVFTWMLYVNSINIVHGRKKNIKTFTFKLNIRESRIFLSTGGGVACLHYAWSIHVVLLVILKFVCDVTDGYS